MYSADCRNFVFLFSSFFFCSFFFSPSIASKINWKGKKKKIEVDELDNLIGFFYAFFSSILLPPSLCLRALYNFHFIKVRENFSTPFAFAKLCFVGLAVGRVNAEGKRKIIIRIFTQPWSFLLYALGVFFHLFFDQKAQRAFFFYFSYPLLRFKNCFLFFFCFCCPRERVNLMCTMREIWTLMKKFSLLSERIWRAVNSSSISNRSTGP